MRVLLAALFCWQISLVARAQPHSIEPCAGADCPSPALVLRGPAMGDTEVRRIRFGLSAAWLGVVGAGAAVATTAYLASADESSAERAVRGLAFGTTLLVAPLIGVAARMLTDPTSREAADPVRGLGWLSYGVAIPLQLSLWVDVRYGLPRSRMFTIFSGTASALSLLVLALDCYRLSRAAWVRGVVLSVGPRALSAGFRF